MLANAPRHGRARVGCAARLPARARASACWASRCCCPRSPPGGWASRRRFEDAWARLDELIIKPHRPPPPRERRPSAHSLDEAGRAELRAQVERQPHKYVAQEWVHAVAGAGARAPAAGVSLRARAPSACACSRSPRPTAIRVMPGGLTRVRCDARLARHQHAARRPLEGHLGAVGRAGQHLVLAAAHHRHAGGRGRHRAATCLRARPRTCSGSAAMASAATAPRAFFA